MIEVEVKFRIHDIANYDHLVDILKQNGFTKKHDLHQIDSIYLQQPQIDFTTFKPWDPVARVRQSNDTVQIAVKKRLNNEASIEHEMVCESFEVACQLLWTLWYNQVVEVDKAREEFSNNTLL